MQVILNELDRFHLAASAIDRLPDRWNGTYALEHRAHIRENGEDMPEIRNWRWSASD